MVPRYVGTVSVNNDRHTTPQASVLSLNFARGATEGLGIGVADKWTTRGWLSVVSYCAEKGGL